MFPTLQKDGTFDIHALQELLALSPVPSLPIELIEKESMNQHDHVLICGDNLTSMQRIKRSYQQHIKCINNKKQTC